jgi:hypothetical protein
MALSQINSASIENGSVSQVDLATGVAGTGPAFSAYQGTSQTLTANVYTKIALNTERFDTNNNFDSTTNYRFTPTVAGYYQINYAVYGVSSGTITNFVGALYKNGSVYEFGPINSLNSNQQYVSSTLVYMNGSTDYLELYMTLNGTGILFATTASGTTNFMSGFLARVA